MTAGGLEGYRLTVHNRGRLSERNLLLCDHIPNHTTFVSADRKLGRVGRERCLRITRLGPGQDTSVHLMLHVNANAAPGTLTNIADITPIAPPGVAAVPPPLGGGAPPVLKVDLPAGAIITRIKPIHKVKAIVRVVARRRALQPPPVTG